MDWTPETPGCIETKPFAWPVILSMAAAKNEANVEPVGSPMGGIQRFEFPQLSSTPVETPAYNAPMAIWPDCHDAKTAEVYAGLAQGVQWRLSSKGPTILALSSPGDGDGKTSLLLNLAPELAKRIDGGVLVFDANFRKPDLSSQLIFSAGRAAGGSNLIYPTNLPGLSVLPAPEELDLRSGDGPSMEHLRQRWPLVLVDTPSLEHAEAVAMAQRCDGVYLVVRLGHTARRAVVESAKVVGRSGGRLLGCIVVG